MSSPALPRSAAATLAELLDHLADDRGDTEVVFPETGRRLRHRELPPLAWGLAGTLARHGVGQGTVVGLLIGSVPEFLPAAFGVWAAGGAITVLPVPPVPTDPASVAAHLATALGPVRHLLVADAGVAIAEHLHRLRPDLVVLPAHDLAPGQAPRSLAPAPGSPAVVQFTSGSTARPKGVVLSHRAVLACFASTAVASSVGPADRVVSWVPLFHDFGLITLLFGVWTGYEHHVFTAWRFIRRPRQVVEHLSASRATVFGGPNFAYDRIAAAYADGVPAGLDLSAWRLALNGGEPVKPATVTDFTTALRPAGLSGTTMFPVYGMAEATMSVACPPPGQAAHALWLDRETLAAQRLARPVPDGVAHGTGLVSVGAPVPGVELRLLGEHGGQVADGAVGEIVLRGPSLAEGYLDDPAATAAVFRDGWLHTGDLGVHVAGQLFVAGRRKDMVIVAGRNFFAEDVEDVVRTALPGGRGRCVALADTERERIVVVTETDDPATAPELSLAVRTLVSATLDLGAVDVHVVPRNTLPRTTSGKWQRGLTARYLRQLTTP
ncbi:acyl-CoA synthetase (AMP-forming)/AMP-acid ligase II [Crossiella equi]|uniref:Acyl-CoA synthetase (AMP-forming)/AMP-acid ligase II n=1 Tax=Crossiella equi TaxID=130796 RepID=A0ABS5A6Q7_9PSEU|nr:AMP-binding protein [Crossiella equi]MBP2471942.1 acyl-CoA synthetase (AMP-forming)/AMP-acid ligase II [Crossiella equi]